MYFLGVVFTLKLIDFSLVVSAWFSSQFILLLLFLFIICCRVGATVRIAALFVIFKSRSVIVIASLALYSFLFFTASFFFSSFDSFFSFNSPRIFISVNFFRLFLFLFCFLCVIFSYFIYSFVRKNLRFVLLFPAFFSILISIWHL